jgi:hypothetical protein
MMSMYEKAPAPPQCRRNIINALKLIASPEAQLEYQQQVPIADVVGEIFCGWADDSFSQSDTRLRALFTDCEWAALVAFDSRFEAISAQMPQRHIRIGEFLANPLSQELADAAKDALRSFPSE